MKLLELTLLNFQCLSGITKIQFSKNPSRNISLIVSQDPEEGQALVDALEWVFLFSPIYTERWTISEKLVIRIDQLHCKIKRSCNDNPTTVSLKLTDDGHKYSLIRKISKEIGSGENISDARFPNDHSTFAIIKDGVTLHHDEMHREIYRMLRTRVAGSFHWEQLKNEQKQNDERFIKMMASFLDSHNSPLIVSQPMFSVDRAKFETWQPVLKLSNLQVLLFTSPNDLLERRKVSHWLNHIKSNIGFLCLFFQNGSSKCTTIHWGENLEHENDWLDQALSSGQAFYQLEVGKGTDA
jgi:hypothetical protein